MKVKLLLTTGILIICLGLTFGQPGTNDLSFNPTDIGFGYGSGAGGHVYSTAIQSDGKIIIGGDFWSYNGTNICRIARLNTDGTLDTSFNPGTGPAGSVRAVSIQSDGKIIIGGDFTSYNGTGRNRIARLNTDGSLDTSFDPGAGANDWVWSISIQSDGQIIIGGDFTSYSGIGRNRIARLSSNGSLDTSFNPGTGANNWVWSTSIQSDGRIIIGGDFTSCNGADRNGVARLNTNGSLDASFNPGTGPNGTVRSTTIQSDGKIILGGRFTSFNGRNRNRIARLNTNGSLDISFNSGTAGNDYGNISSISIQDNGKIIIGGLFTSYQETGSDNIARLNTDGSLDTSFNPGAGTNGLLWTISIQSDGKIIVGGGIFSYTGLSRNNVFRLHADGSLDISFNPGTGVSGTVYSTSIQDDGKIIIGGWFDSYNGTGINNIARLNTDGSLDTTFNPGTGPRGLIQTISIQSDGRIIIGGDFTFYNGTGRNRIARLNKDGSLDTSFNPGTGVSGAIYSISIQDDGKIIIGGWFDSFNGTGRNNIVRLNSDGSLDTTFNPGRGASGSIQAISIQSDGKIIIGGDFTSYSGTGRNKIARLNANGSLDISFNPGTGANFPVTGWTASIRTISIQDDGKIIIGGRFTSFNETPSVWIARLNINGALDRSFLNPGLTANDFGFVSTSSIQSDGKIIIGGLFTSSNEISRNNIARLNTDGTFDTCFDPGTGVIGTVYSTSIQSDGKIIIGGSFDSYNGTGRNRIARINGGDCVTEISALSGNKEIIVYPNPFTSQMVLQAANPLSNATVSIYNTFGQRVMEIKNITGQKVILYRENLPAGIYFVCLTENNKHMATKKIIITD